MDISKYVLLFEECDLSMVHKSRREVRKPRRTHEGADPCPARLCHHHRRV